MSLSKADLEKAKFCAVLCHAVYDPDLHKNPKRILEVVKGIDTDKQFKTFEKVGFDTQTLVLEKDDTLYIVFQGTQSKWDWLANLILRFKRSEVFGSYHTGFITVSELSFPVVGNHVLSVLKTNPNKKVVLTGHSLGGAMATMYAHILKQKHPDVKIESLVTFGQPRCGNFRFSEYLNSLNIDYKRFVNQGDYIADVPLPIVRGWWSHAGIGFVLSDNEMLLDSTNYETTWSLRVWAPAVAFYQLLKAKKFKFKDLKKEEVKPISLNHDMPLYIKRIEEEIARK